MILKSRMLFVFIVALYSFSSMAVSVGEEKAVSRIVALAPHSVELLYTLGVGDKIVGTSEFADYPEVAKSIPRVGGYSGINLERVLELAPDVVIAWEGGNSPGDIKQIEKLGIQVYRTQTKQLGDIAEELKILGALVGEPKRGRQEAAKFTERLNRLRTTYGQRKPISFFYQLWANPLKGMAAGSWINEVLEGCGGENVLTNTDNHYPSVSMENVLVLAPEVIIQPSQHGTDQWNAIDWQRWQEIPAVKNNHIYPVNGDLLHRFSTRILDGMFVVCERLDGVRRQREKST